MKVIGNIPAKRRENFYKVLGNGHLKKTLATLLFLLLTSHAYPFILGTLDLYNDIPGNCGHPLLFITSDLQANADDVSVIITITSTDFDSYNSSTTNTVSLNDATNFQHLGSIQFVTGDATSVREVYRYIGSYSQVINTATIINLDVQYQGEEVIEQNAITKSCYSCPSCPSRVFMVSQYNNLSDKIFDAAWPYSDYNNAFADLPFSYEQTNIMQIFDWMMGFDDFNTAPTLNDYLNMLNPAMEGNSQIPSDFCRASPLILDCTCQQNVFYDLQYFIDQLSGITDNTSDDYYDFLTAATAYYTTTCYCSSGYNFFIQPKTTGDGYDLALLPLGAGMPTIFASIVFDGGIAQTTIAYSYNFSPYSFGGIVYNYDGTFSYVNGFSKIITVDPFADGVEPFSDLTVHASGPLTFCAGGSVQLTAASILTGAFVWSDASTTSSISVNTSGNYSVILTDDEGCSATANAGTVMVNENPAPDAGPDGTICYGATYDVGVGPVNGYSYAWSPASGLVATNDPNPLVSPTLTTTYTLTVVDENGCTGTDDVVVTVNQIIANAGSNITMCTGYSIAIGSTLGATGGSSPYTYSWSPIDGLSATDNANPNATPTITTTYTLIASDANGCTSTASITLTVHNCADPCSALIAAFTTGAGPNPIQFTSTTASIVPVVAYHWDFGDGTYSSNPNPLHQFVSAGNHKVCLTVVVLDSAGHSCCDSSCQIVCVTQDGFNCNNYLPLFTMEQITTNTVLYNNTSTVTGPIQPGYLWTFDDGGTSTEQDPIHYFNGGSGLYNTCLIIVNPLTGDKCDNVLCKNINSGARAEADLSPVQNADFMLIDPNPAKDFVQVSYKNVCSTDAHLIIYNGKGEEKFNGTIDPQQSKINVDISLWPTGFYTARLFVDEKLLEVKRFSKTN